jgi:hypothetical protein
MRKGGKNLIIEVSGKRLQTSRNFSAEEEGIQTIFNQCPTLSSIESHSDLEWILEEPELCLQVLLELQDLEEKVIVEWPEGEKFRINHRADISQFHIRIQKENDWFSFSGDLSLNDKKVIEMQSLLELLEQTPGKFVPMKDGGFMALTDSFRKQLDELRTYSDYSKSGYRFSPLIAPLLEWLLKPAA